MFVIKIISCGIIQSINFYETSYNKQLIKTLLFSECEIVNFTKSDVWKLMTNTMSIIHEYKETFCNVSMPTLYINVTKINNLSS